ncbi:MAG: hypothetical protein Kow00109_25000 [Acidobacteriota bacterium]
MMEDQTTPPGGSTPPPPEPPPATPPPPQAPPGGEYVSPNRTIMLILAYLGILALIPLLAEKEDQEVQWHAKHGIILMVTWIIVWIALIIIGFVPMVGQVVGCLLSILLPLAILAIHVVCIIKALNGEKFRLPFVSDFADQWQ